MRDRGEQLIARAEAAELPAIGAMLGRAFAENPVARACLGHCSVEDRLAKVSRLNLGLARAAMRAGEVAVRREGGAILGAQLSFAPGHWPLDLRSWLAMAWGAIGTGWRGLERYSVYDQHVSPLHPREPHLYLWVLGVEPGAQGRGIGSAFLRALGERADRERWPAYLETDRETSVRLYQRHGFVIENELTIAPLGGVKTWTMRRSPGGSAGRTRRRGEGRGGPE